MKFIPDALVELIDSKKSALFLFMVALWTPAARDLTGHDIQSLMWLTIAFSAYALSQGLSDLGMGIVGTKSPPRIKWDAKPTEQSAGSQQPPQQS